MVFDRKEEWYLLNDLDLKQLFHSIISQYIIVLFQYLEESHQSHDPISNAIMNKHITAHQSHQDSYPQSHFDAKKIFISISFSALAINFAKHLP